MFAYISINKIKRVVLIRQNSSIDVGCCILGFRALRAFCIGLGRGTGWETGFRVCFLTGSLSVTVSSNSALFKGAFLVDCRLWAILVENTLF
jgi:hypothetical protein